MKWKISYHNLWSSQYSDTKFLKTHWYVVGLENIGINSFHKYSLFFVKIKTYTIHNHIFMQGCDPIFCKFKLLYNNSHTKIVNKNKEMPIY